MVGACFIGDCSDYAFKLRFKDCHRGSACGCSKRFFPIRQRESSQRWWTAFDDAQLNKLVKRALQSNFNLRSAWQRLRQAQAIVDRESSSLFPDVKGTLDGEHRRPEAVNNQNLRLGLTSKYELDL
ncbi:MAG: hypothetical protein GF313_14370 [Caldithrix sp.]|nr:hypothetical protein [Caldithrix sp.]